MTTQARIVTPGDRGAPLTVIGTSVTVLLSETDSKSQRITVQSGDEGFGPAPHSHAWDEQFYITKGCVNFTCGGQTTSCPAGTLVHIPGGTIHAFAYGPGGGEMLEVTGAGSDALRMFAALDREIPPGPPDVPKIVRVAAEYGVTFHL